MIAKGAVLVCWHAERAGFEVLERILPALRQRGVKIQHIYYLMQEKNALKPPIIDGVSVERISVPINDPTKHEHIYRAMRKVVVPKLAVADELHINVSPGTPAMHAVWMVLHAAGALPQGAKLWSSQFLPETRRTRLDPVSFPLTTYLNEIKQWQKEDPQLAVYDIEARSPRRREAFERLRRYAVIPGAPLLILGERGVGKTRLVETVVATMKQRKKVVTVPCGGLNSSLAESFLFGHKKGAFTGAASDRDGVLKEADGGILFLDEVQDLPKTAQRKLVRVFQDHNRRYRPLGSDKELRADIELVCASNLRLEDLHSKLDADLFDRLSHFIVTVPPLRECREDVLSDWEIVWREMRQSNRYTELAPMSPLLVEAMSRHGLPGNLRDLQRLSLLVMAWWEDGQEEKGFRMALEEWQQRVTHDEATDSLLGIGTRKERMKRFCERLAWWAKDEYGTWDRAAEILDCTERTLRTDAGNSRK
jgi:DNA-binding NtrC family response regulator